jgi:hypothetical protein
MRDSILQAADHIERHPDAFDFCNCYVPKTLDGTGCAFGWVAYFAVRQKLRFFKLRPLIAGSDVAMKVIGTNMVEFFDRMRELNRKHRKGGHLLWQDDPQRCATLLRRYADKYYPAPISGIPASVRLIFAPKETIDV